MPFTVPLSIKTDCNQLQQLQLSCNSNGATMESAHEFELKCRGFANRNQLQQLQSSCNWRTKRRIFNLPVTCWQLAGSRCFDGAEETLTLKPGLLRQNFNLPVTCCDTLKLLSRQIT